MDDDGKQSDFVISENVPQITDITITEEGVFSLLHSTDMKKHLELIVYQTHL